MKNDIEFNSAYDLYIRVKPALKTKLKELERENYDYIKQEDIWNYLIKNKWKESKGLVLCDVVDDILNVDNKKLDRYVKDIKKQMKEKVELEDLEIL